MSKVAELDKYQKLAAFTDQYPQTFDGFCATAFGLCSESGEFANKLKKLIRDHGGKLNDFEVLQSLGDELGDLLWYLAIVANRLGYSLSDIATMNINKLIDRKSRGLIGGQKK